jgi:hypothetical protein
MSNFDVRLAAWISIIMQHNIDLLLMKSTCIT